MSLWVKPHELEKWSCCYTCSAWFNTIWQFHCSSEGRSSYCSRNFFIPLAEVSIVISLRPRTRWHQTFCSSLICFSILVLFGELENSPEKFTSFSLSLSLSHTIYDNLAMSMKHKKKKVKILITWSRRECPSSLWLIARIHTSLVGIVKWILIPWCRRSAALELERLGFKFQLCHFLAMWTQTSYLTSFGLSFLVCKLDFIELWKFRKIT